MVVAIVFVAGVGGLRHFYLFYFSRNIYMYMYKLFHASPFKAVNNVSVILRNGKVIMEMGKVQRERVATLIDNRLIHLLILSRFLFRVSIKCSA